jgi:hypothetical protein
MLKSILAVVAAAVVAAVVVGLVPPPETAVAATETAAPSLAASGLVTPSLVAATQAEAALPAPAVQTDQSGCTRAWPYYEQSCLHSSRQPNGKTRVVRVIADDKSVANRALRARR